MQVAYLNVCVCVRREESVRSWNRGLGSITDRCSGMSARSSPDRGRTERASEIEPNSEFALGLFSMKFVELKQLRWQL